jgi:hypothetical protein
MNAIGRHDTVLGEAGVESVMEPWASLAAFITASTHRSIGV